MDFTANQLKRLHLENKDVLQRRRKSVEIRGFLSALWRQIQERYSLGFILKTDSLVTLLDLLAKYDYI